jgi:hypothetical protein
VSSSLVSVGGPVRLSPPADPGTISSITRNDYGRPPFGGRPLVSSGLTAPSYWINSKIRNVGRYRAMTMAPTAPPTTAIITGSISEVSDSTAAVTSSS